MAPLRPRAVARQRPRALPSDKHRLTVLLALGDSAQRTSIARSLRTLGCRVVLASLGRTDHHPAPPPPSTRPTVALDAVVLDLSALPGAGLAALEALRTVAPSLPAIVVVAQGDGATCERALRLDPWVLFEAPALDDAIVVTVMNLAARQQRWRPPPALGATCPSRGPGQDPEPPAKDPRSLCA